MSDSDSQVAAGEELPEEIRNKEVPFNGWSVESRIYAEDPLRNFLPSIGGLSHYTEPDAQVCRRRVDGLFVRVFFVISFVISIR